MVHVGVLRSNGSESLLKLMTGVYVPAVLANHTWPDSVRKDFTGQLHKFMAYLTELTNDAKGVTVLYIPEEEIGDPAVACKEKEQVQVCSQPPPVFVSTRLVSLETESRALFVSTWASQNALEKIGFRASLSASHTSFLFTC